MSERNISFREPKSISDWQKIMKEVASLIDEGFDKKDEQLTNKAFAELDQLQREKSPPQVSALIHYFRSNAYANRLNEKNSDIWAWEQPEIQAQILELRKAVGHEGFSKLHPIRRSQILTNLANQMSTVGRFIEALQIWEDALAVEPKFAMAHGNRGVSVRRYASALYDPGQASLYYLEARNSLDNALSDDALFDGEPEPAKRLFQRHRDEISQIISEYEIQDLDDWDAYPLGSSSSEQAYRKWCLQHRLFINPLNDLGTHSVAATDVLTLPSITADISANMPAVIGFFNQIKQEFASARFIFFEGAEGASSNEAGHFADHNVRLYNTLDYPVYGLHIEKMKAGYRVAYSILDKIAVFLNSYLNVGADPDRVNFRNIWYDTKNKRRQLRFQSSRNWALRGLFWLSKDFYENDFKEVTMPDAKAFSDIRNYLEHKYLKVHETWAAPSETIQKGALTSYSITERDLEYIGVRLLKHIRDALIYLSLAVHAEEANRQKAGSGPQAQMWLDLLDDESKR